MNLKVSTSYFFIHSIIGLVASLVGFGYTYMIPMSQGAFKAPVSVHIHGAFAFTWVSLYFFQNLMIQQKNYRLHKSMGVASVIVLIGFFISHYYTLGFVISRDLPLQGDTVYGLGLISHTSTFLVLLLGLAGVYYRKKPDSHKRLMFLATVVILWPAWGRWRHYFPSIEASTAAWLFMYIIPYSFILLAFIWEQIKYRKIHPVLLVVGSLLILEGLIAGFYSEWEWTGQFVKWLYK